MSSALIMAALAVASVPEPTSYALIVANNLSLDDEKPLSFADDDGARWYELFEALGAHTVLLADLDARTQTLHPEAAAASRLPTGANFARYLSEFHRRMDRAADAGVDVTFYFIYAGHGNVAENGEGYVHLSDTKLERRALFEDVVAPSKARFNHLVIDACKSYFMVNSRGATADPDDRVDPAAAEAVEAARLAFLQRGSLESYPNTGVIVSTSSARESHEWTGYEAGVFSHQIRSALTGAADVNGDGKVEYSEVAAFVTAANAAVSNPKARVELYARAPSNHRREPLFRPGDLPTPRVVFPASAHGHFTLEDERGVRYADFHKGAGDTAMLNLPVGRAFFLRHERGELRVSSTQREIVANAEAFAPVELAARGGVVESLRRDLFQVPFSKSFYLGFMGSADHEPVTFEASTLTLDAPPLESPSLSPVAWGLLGGAALSAATATAFAVLARRTQAELRGHLETTGQIDPELEVRRDSQKAWAWVLGGVAAAGAVAGTTLLIFDEDEDETGDTPASLGVGPTGLWFDLRF